MSITLVLAVLQEKHPGISLFLFLFKIVFKGSYLSISSSSFFFIVLIKLADICFILGLEFSLNVFQRDLEIVMVLVLVVFE